MSKKWSQAFNDHPVTSLKSNDLVAVSVSDGMGGYVAQDNAGRWGELSQIDENTIFIADNGDADNNGALLTPVLTLTQANIIAGADLTHRWKIICYKNSLTENLSLLPNVDYYFYGTTILFSNLTFPEWTTVGASSAILSNIYGLTLFPQNDVSGGFTGEVPDFPWRINLNDCSESNLMDTPRAITFEGFTSSALTQNALNFSVQLNNFNSQLEKYEGFLIFKFNDSIRVITNNSVIQQVEHDLNAGSGSIQVANHNNAYILQEGHVTTSQSSGIGFLYLFHSGKIGNTWIINAQHTNDSDTQIQVTPDVYRLPPDTSGSTTNRWSFTPFTDQQGLNNAQTEQLKYISQSSTYTDSNVWNNLGVGTFGKPYPTAAGIPTTGLGVPFSFSLIGEIADAASAQFNPFITFIGSGNEWYQSSGSKSINDTLWGIGAFSGAYSRTQFADFSRDTWDLDFSAAGGLPKSLDYYNCIFSSATNSGGTYNITAVNIDELFNFNNCIGGIYPLNYNANFTIKGGSVFFNGGTIPSLTLQSRNANGGAQFTFINGASFNNATSVNVTNDSKADSTVFIENSSVKQSNWNFTGTGGSTMTVFTNCLDPANVTVGGSGVSILPTHPAQCTRVDFSPTNYTPTSPPSGWITALEQHLEGINNALGSSTGLFQPGYINGLTPAFSSLITFTISTGHCVDSTNAFNITVGSPITIDITASGAGGLDTGSVATNTKYAMYVIADSTNVNPVSAVFSTSFSSPTLPAGYDKFRYVGSARTVAGANQFNVVTIRGNSNERIYYYDSQTSEAAFKVLTGGTATTAAAVDCSALANAFTTDVAFRYVANAGATTGNGFSLTGTITAATFFREVTQIASLANQSITCLVPLESSSTVNYLWDSTSTGRSLDLYIAQTREYI